MSEAWLSFVVRIGRVLMAFLTLKVFKRQLISLINVHKLRGIENLCLCYCVIDRLKNGMFMNVYRQYEF